MDRINDGQRLMCKRQVKGSYQSQNASKRHTVIDLLPPPASPACQSEMPVNFSISGEALKSLPQMRGKLSKPPNIFSKVNIHQHPFTFPCQLFIDCKTHIQTQPSIQTHPHPSRPNLMQHQWPWKGVLPCFQMNLVQ